MAGVTIPLTRRQGDGSPDLTRASWRRPESCGLQAGWSNLAAPTAPILPSLPPGPSTDFKFLRDRLWDDDHGGFHWEVDSRTGIPLKTNRHLYGQAFGLFALSEYTIATDSAEARSMADRLHDLIERNAYDSEFDGYHEYLTPDWHPIGSDEISYMGHPASVKQLNTHLHLMEAVTAYTRLNGSDLVRDRLRELIRIQSRHVVVDDGIGCTDLHTRDWRKPDDPASNIVNYGHDLENIWLLIEAHRAMGLSESAELELYERLFRSSVQNGWDLDKGGLLLQRTGRA